MSNVDLTIGGRQFTVACAEGEESHVVGLGEMIDTKLAAMGGAAGQSETRMLLFAALLLADELHDTKLPANHAEAAAPAAPALSPESAQRLDAIALRLENLATRLES